MIGDKIRQLRESENMLLRHLAAQLDMDSAMLSKMGGTCQTLKAASKKLAYPLLTLCLADKVLNRPLRTKNTKNKP